MPNHMPIIFVQTTKIAFLNSVKGSYWGWVDCKLTVEGEIMSVLAVYLFSESYSD